MSVVKLEECRQRIREELDRTVDFWLRYSHDTEHGGFFTCIGRDGTVYDQLKYVWLQGRQVWMYCRLYRTMERFHRPEILQAAKAGGEFLRKFARVSSDDGGGGGGGAPRWKCAFCLTRDGKAVKVQRTIFSECFYILALDELSRVTGDEDMQREAEQMMEQLIFWVRVDSSGLGRPRLPGDVPANSMAVPMMLLCLVQQLSEGRGQLSEGRGQLSEGRSQEVAERFRELSGWCVQQILQHVQRDGSAVLENVSMDGAELPGCHGRLQNPGHALEAGWFLLQFGVEQQDRELQATAIEKFMELPYSSGWDREHGGLFYFLDVDGTCPTQLEWSMKLWWPHCEALVAFLMAYSHSRRPELLQSFSDVYQYTFSHFPDAQSGEWFGYLTREGKVALDFKGGPFKGFFHVPRCLYMCERLLDDLLTKND